MPKMKNMSAAELVKAIREKYRDYKDDPMTQDALAHIGGWTMNTVHRWETGKVRPHKNSLRALELIYELGPEKFTERTRVS